ncbi:MAG TPA: ankyrin repeat domain-containing protein [Rickettsia endosymbiont of Omalisus fontisbellaquei]|nr:ankyrin repeat domain-containing protein [Rickettsia endosymbiont of Omalisus fontisbellaquei]
MPINLKHPLENKTLEELDHTKNKRQKISDNPIIEEKATPDNAKIFEEAKKGNFEGIKSYVEQGISIDTTDQFGMTILHRVIQSQKTELATRIINELKPNANIQAKNGWTPLYLACVKQEVDLAELLLKNNANPNLYYFSTKISPLYIASEKTNIPLMKLLLNYGADVNFEGPRGIPLHAAAMADTNLPKKEAIKLLISYQSKITKNSFGFTPKDYWMQDDKSFGNIFDELLGDLSEKGLME